MTEDREEPVEQTKTPETPRKAFKRRYLLIGVAFVMAVAALLYWLSTRGRVSTDDAQVDTHFAPISARVSGYVKNIYVNDNQLVVPGQLLVQLDQRDLLSKLGTAEADLATQRAQAAASAGQESLIQKTAPATAQQASEAASAAAAAVNTAQKQIVSAQEQANSAQAGVEAAQAAVTSAQSDVQSASAQVQSAQAAVKAAQANLNSAQAQAQKTASDAIRYQGLYSRGAASKQALEAAQATNTSAQEAVNASKENVASAQASLDQARARRSSANAAVSQAKARLASAKATAAQAQNAINVARSAYTQAQAQAAAAQAAAAGAQTVPQQYQVAEAQRKAALARAKQSAANVNSAELQLSYTTIVAPVQGIVNQKTVQIGQYVQPGQQLMTVVPTQVWVTANFKETQITDMRVGQRAIVEVDTYPGVELEGKVQSIGGASGASSSLLPPQNATGNFVKVVQRFPVKIVITQRLPKGIVLRPGASVTATVYVSGGK